jgi:hypothetical protein
MRVRSSVKRVSEKCRRVAFHNVAATCNTGEGLKERERVRERGFERERV